MFYKEDFNIEARRHFSAIAHIKGLHDKVGSSVKKLASVSLHQVKKPYPGPSSIMRGNQKVNTNFIFSAPMIGSTDCKITYVTWCLSNNIFFCYMHPTNNNQSLPRLKIASHNTTFKIKDIMCLWN